MLAAIIAGTGVVHAQGGKAAGGEAIAAQVSLQEETFSLPLADASVLLRKFPSDAERYKELVRRAECKQAKLERLMVVRTISGQQAKGESVYELSYPTEFAPTRAAGTNAAAGRVPAEGAVIPGDFQTRNLGNTLNFTPLIGPDSRTVNITLIPESSTFAGYKGAGDQKWTRQPVFEAQRLTTSVIVKDGEPFLLGTLTPPASNGIAPAPKEPRVWLDFITVQVLPVGK